jgi:hypothetical protein
MRWLGLAAALLLASCSGGETVEGAEKAVAHFHNELNGGAYQQIYGEGDKGLKSATSQADLIKFLQAVHQKLGAFKNGKRTGWRVNYNTAGNSTVVQFDSNYEKGAATETFTFVGSADAPRLLGYNIDSQALVTG